VLVTSRSAAEYRAMFGLPAGASSGTVLDCSAGGASFAAETGDDVVAVDPSYAAGRAALADGVRAALADGDRIIAAHADRFDWSWYGERAARAAMRTAAAAAFLADLARRPGRYVAGALPHLPLRTGSVDLALCSHLLFTWADRFDEHWHRRALLELARVARREVRVYPLVVQGTGDPVPFLDGLRADLQAAGLPTTLQPVPYRFQRGAIRMLVVDTTGR
jgi:hypothetical protein